MSTLDTLDQMTVPGTLYESLPDGSVRCFACAHRCLIRPGRRGICQVRFNEDGVLKVPSGYVAALQSDPIEKKPFFHVYPGQDALTFGMLGCDMHCGFCQNWLTSQAGRDEESNIAIQLAQRISPEEMIRYAQRMGSGVVASSYNEPLITSEWAVAVFQEAKKAGLPCAFISNGNATREALDLVGPYLSAYKIDLKTMQDKQYRKLGAVLNNILDGIKLVHEKGLWLEIVTLVIPGFNDDPAELWDAARFLASLSPDIPWHVTAFHPDYKMTDPDPTSAQTLIKAAEIGQEAGLRYVYAGNIPGHVGELENTVCPNCHTTLIERYGYVLLDYRITAAGTCPQCGTKVPGIWTDKPETVRLHGLGMPRRVYR